MSIADKITSAIDFIGAQMNLRNAPGPSDFQMWVAQDPVARATATLADYRQSLVGADEDVAAYMTGLLTTPPRAGIATTAQAGITQLADGPGVLAGTNAYFAVTPLALNNAQLLDAGAGGRLGRTSKDVSGGDWNTQIVSGHYEGSGMANAPGGSSGWNFVTVQRFSDVWTSQVAHTFTIAGTGQTAIVGALYQRMQTNGTWSPWRRILDDTVGALAPARTIGVQDSFETIVQPGVYQFNGGAGLPAGFPTGGDAYGELVVFAQQYGVVQLYVGATTFIRSQWNALNQNPQNMGRANWQKLTTTTVAPL